ncbi:MAG: M20/M25/M40 family metallo-hydrolase [Anaerolineaceae bacterium]|nr:M20/M25/M40 family metallo-hydrolase [Anaerolineaceae bacterium]
MSVSFDAQQVYKHIRYLSEEIGARFSGSENDRKATDYIRAYFNDLGLDVQEQSFGLTSGTHEKSGMQVLEPDLGEIPCFPFIFSSEPGMQEIIGEVVFVEGVEAPWIGTHLRGKIVVWTWPDSMEIFASYQKLVRQKPLAIILLSAGFGTQPKHLQMPGELKAPYQKVPTFFIRWEDGFKMFKEKASRVRLYVHVEKQESETRNVIAELKGTDFPDEIVLIGGHHDSVYNVPGAMDNAAGVAAVMELARIYSQRGTKRTIRFIAWGAEEFGLWGSKRYLKLLKEEDKKERKEVHFYDDVDKTELDKHLLVVSLDVLGVALTKDVCFVLGTEDINAVLAHLSKELGIPHDVKNAFYGTDSIPFAKAGIPTISYASVGGGAGTQLMHTPADNLEIIDMDHLQRSGDFIDTFLQRSVAGAQAWPFKREVPEKQQKDLEKAEESYKWIFEQDEGEDQNKEQTSPE